VDVDVALARASSSKEKGVLELPHFVAEVQATVEKAQVLGVPFAMAVLRSKHADIRSALLKAVHVRRTGDLLTTDGTDVFVFFYACSLTMAPKVLAGVFDGNMAKYVNEIDWMTSEHDIHNMIADLRGKKTTYEASAQAQACAEIEGMVSSTDASMAETSVHPSDAVPTGSASARVTTTPASEPAQLTPHPAHVPKDIDPGPAVHAALLPEPSTPAKVTRKQWSRPNHPKNPSEPHNAPEDLTDHLSADSSCRAPNAAEDNNLVTDRRVVELIRRLALPTKIHDQTKKSTGTNDKF
jgi:hypothetical protein